MLLEVKLYLFLVEVYRDASEVMTIWHSPRSQNQMLMNLA